MDEVADDVDALERRTERVRSQYVTLDQFRALCPRGVAYRRGCPAQAPHLVGLQ